MNLWILTEERPKKPVIEQIIRKLGSDQNLKVNVDKIKIQPVTHNGKFSFLYKIQGASVHSIDNIFLKVISGESSFVDFLVFLQEKEPQSDLVPKYAIEETKTSDAESRNTGVYQRCTKFVFVDFYYPKSCCKIMLYNIQIGTQGQPTETSIFGTRMLLTMDVQILGKTLDPNIFKPFTSIDELIEFKNKMGDAPAGNVPIRFSKFDDRIEVSGRLIKAGALSHDPNIGALSIISKTLRVLGWSKGIRITKHGLSQNHLTGRNKFVRVANQLKVELDGLNLPVGRIPTQYWSYDISSEKVATIFLHLILEELDDAEVIYENHAGCERGYFKTFSGGPIAVHKYINNDKAQGALKIPDLIVRDSKRKQILIIEGKPFDTVDRGISDLKECDPIEREYVRKYYPGYAVTRHVVLFGGSAAVKAPSEVAFQLSSNGDMVLFPSTPPIIKDAVQNIAQQRAQSTL